MPILDELSTESRGVGDGELKSVRNAGAQLDAFVAYSPIAMAMFDSEMRYLAVSERWLRDHQLVRSPVGLLLYDVLPEIPEAWRAGHRRCLAGATESSEGEPFPRADGRVQWVRWLACPWRDIGGEVGGIILMTEDITTRKEAEAEAARLAAVVTHSSDAIIAKNLDSIVTSWNAGATRLFGYRAEEMIGHSIARIVPPERLGEEDQILKWLRAGEAIEHFETQRVARNGRVLDVSLSISPVRNAFGAIVGVSKIVRDVTDGIEGQKALKAAHDRADEILSSIADGFYALDADWRFVYFNERAEHVTNKKREEVLGRGIFEAFPLTENSEVHKRYLQATGERAAIEFEALSPTLQRWTFYSVYPPAKAESRSIFATSPSRSESNARGPPRRSRRSAPTRPSRSSSRRRATICASRCSRSSS